MPAQIPTTGFQHSDQTEPHRGRTRAILREHPEIRGLIGKNPHTFWAVAGIVALQAWLAWAMAGGPWWLLLLTAYTVGALANHALFVMIHECAHNLIFRRQIPNTLTGMLANLPLVMPTSVSFQRYHLKHHAFQGVHDMDADLPSAWELRVFGRSALGKALWLLCFPLILLFRSARLTEIKVVDRWSLLNLAVQVTFNVLVWQLLGPGAFWYLLASMFFSVGLHPVGARWIQEHFLTDAPQETYSYYGIGNWTAFNVGYHNEHHDFPSVPWNRLPLVKQLGGAWYDGLVSHRSWTRLLFQFLLRGDLGLFSRMVRDDRGGIRPPHAEFEPDVALADEARRAGPNVASHERRRLEAA
jgi:sphingolipid delta-4 desaturase